MAEQENTSSELSRLYDHALEEMQNAAKHPRGIERQTAYLNSRKLFDQCLELIEKLSLFSDNETLEDVGTSELKYILTSAYLCKIMLSIDAGSNRFEVFNQAKVYALKFLNLINVYNVTNSPRLEKVLKCDDNEDMKQKTSLQDAMRARDEKIEKYKARKILDDNIEELERRIKVGIDVDDEIRREYYINLINRFIEDTIESLDMEIRMALLFERTQCDATPTDLASSSSRPNKPTYTIVKDEIQKLVFGIGYPSKPTVTVDEFITKKIKDGTYQPDLMPKSNSLQRYAEKPDLRKTQEEESDEEKEAKRDKDDEAELSRLRNWDNFRDETPRGSGNRKNMG